MLRFLLVLALFAASTAVAHDFWINNSNYKSLTDQSHCCGDNDCVAISPDNVKVTAAGYALSTPFAGEVVPYSDSQTSEDENYWRCKRYDGTRRCFFAPYGGS